MIYEYKCSTCRNYFALEFPYSKTVRNGKHTGARCPQCKSHRVQKVISYPNIQFKGSGFYSTDKVKNG